jgi:uncharacterized protein YggE
MHKFIASPVKFCASVVIALGLVSTNASAQSEDPPASTIRVTGEASVTSRPDRVELDLGVVTRGASSQQAATENARVAQNVLAALRKALGAKATIETVSYALQPDYQYPQGGEPKITGYTAINVVRVTQDDVASAGVVIDAATRSGANEIERIRFTLKDENAAKANALRVASLDARAKANSLASAFGLQVVRIRSVDEASPTPRPLYDLAFRSGGTTTPIEPGTIETTATVALVVEFGNRR